MGPPSTPTKSHRAGSNPFKTPTKGSPLASTKVLPHGSPTASSAYPQTPTSSSRHPQDLFKTPTRPASASKRGPSTPQSAVKLRTPPVASPAHASRDPNKRQMDASFHFNTSPSSFRELVGRHSNVMSPNSRRATAGAKRRQDEEALLSTVYTPRTKARKRLRGEEVPPTPQQLQPTDIQEDDFSLSPTLGARTGLASTQASPSKARSSRLRETDNGAEYQRLQPGPSKATTSSASGRLGAATKKRAGGIGRSLSAFWGSDFERKDDPSKSHVSSKQAKGEGVFRRANTLATSSMATHSGQGKEALSPSAAKLAALRRNSKVVGQLSMEDDDEDEDEVLTASPQKPRRNDAFTPNQRLSQRAVSPTTSRRGQPNTRKFQSLFDEGGEEGAEDDDGGELRTGVEGAMDLDTDMGTSYDVNLDEAADAGLDQDELLDAGGPSGGTSTGPLHEKPAKKASKVPDRTHALVTLPPSTLLLDDFSSDSESEGGQNGSARTKRGKGQRNGQAVPTEGGAGTSSTRASQSPSKAIFLRAYRRFGALTLDHESRINKGEVPEDADTQNSAGGSQASADHREDDDAAAEDADQDADADDLFRRLSTARYRVGPHGPASALDHATSTKARQARTAPQAEEALPETTATATTGTQAPFALGAYSDAILSLDVNPSARTRAHALSSRRRALAGLLAGSDGHSQTTGSTSAAGTGGTDSDLVAEVEREIEEQSLALAQGQGQQDQRGGHSKGQRGGQKQTWGGAKAANRQDQGKGKGKDGGFRLGKARRGLGMAGAVGTLVLSDEEEDGPQSGKGKAPARGKGKGAAGAQRKTVFRRVGRSGLDDDEETDDSQGTFLDGDEDEEHGSSSYLLSDEGEAENEEPDALARDPSRKPSRGRGRAPARLRAQDADDDWASDVDEDEWGWDGADMEAMDVL